MTYYIRGSTLNPGIDQNFEGQTAMLLNLTAYYSVWIHRKDLPASYSSELRRQEVKGKTQMGMHARYMKETLANNMDNFSGP